MTYFEALELPTTSELIEKNPTKTHNETYSNTFFKHLLKLLPNSNNWPSNVLFIISLYSHGNYLKCYQYYLCHNSIVIDDEYLPYINNTIQQNELYYLCNQCSNGQYFTKCEQANCHFQVYRNKSIRLDGEYAYNYCESCISKHSNTQFYAQCHECKVYDHKTFRVKCCRLIICKLCIDNYTCNKCNKQFEIGCETCVINKKATCYECQNEKEQQNTLISIKQRIPWEFPQNE